MLSGLSSTTWLFKKVLNGPRVKALQKPESWTNSIIIRIHKIFVF